MNLDRSRNSVADVLADACALPIESGTAERIEAYQLLEHLDHVRCKHALSEWFRVLSAHGTLAVETPDLESSLRRLVRGRRGERSDIVQWIFGVDSPGLQHKCGFTREVLRDLLTEVGFEAVKEEKALTHTYEPGLRFECSKPEVSQHAELMARLRKEIRRQLPSLDSMILIPIEELLANTKATLSSLASSDLAAFDALLATFAVRNPAVALALVDACHAQGVVKDSDVLKRRRTLESLAEIELHKRLFTLWKRSKKEPGLVTEFAAFIDRNESLVRRRIVECASEPQELRYIMSLPPSEIGLLDLRLTLLEAERLFAAGSRSFVRGDLSEALRAFSESIEINPENPLSHWNVARLELHLGHGIDAAKSSYQSALSLSGDAPFKSTLEFEAQQIECGDGIQVPRLPLFDLRWAWGRSRGHR